MITMQYSGDYDRLLCVITDTLADGDIYTPTTEVSIGIGMLDGIQLWTSGTMSTAPSGSIDIVLQGKTGDMPVFITTGTISLSVISTSTPIVVTATEVANFKYSMLKVVSIKNNLGGTIGDTSINITGMDRL